MTQRKSSPLLLTGFSLALICGDPVDAHAKEGALWDIGLAYAVPSYSVEADRSGAVAASADLSASWKVTESTRLGFAGHALADAYSYQDGNGNEFSLSINHFLFGASIRQSFGNDNQGLFARADAGVVTTSVTLTVNDAEAEAPGGSGFGFLTRLGYGIPVSGDLNIAPQITFAGHSLENGFNSSVELGASVSF